MLFNRLGEHIFRLIDLHTNLGQVRDFQGRSVLRDQGFDIKAVELEVPVLYMETFLGKIESLFYQVSVSIVAQCRFCNLW